MSEEEKKYERRSVKTLNTAAAAGAHQKEWFMSLKPRVEAGEPFIFANAGMPLEISVAMDIPCVVSQWWVAINAAKQRGPAMFGYLDDAGYRNDVCSYCISGLACALDSHPEEGPWGGLPKPSMVICVDQCSNAIKINELTAKEFGVKFHSTATSVPVEADYEDPWWENASDHWNENLLKYRLDYAETQIRNLVRFLENETGRKLDMNKLVKTINLSHEQESYFRMARDLIAHTVPAPIGISDTVGAIMQAQWHRGTEWGRDHAKAFYEEIKERVDNGLCAVQDEKIRLMWIGRGLWFNLAFYQYFEEKYKAAFVWSMYQATGADFYVKNIVDDNPLRAIAANEAMPILHTPPWNSNWYLKEAFNNKIDGVVYLVPENCMNNGDFAYYITKLLEDNGFPVTVLRADPANDKKWDQTAMTAAVEELIEKRIIPNQNKKV